MRKSDPLGRRILLLPEWQQNVHIWRHSKLRQNTNWNKQNWCYCQSKNFSGTSDTVRRLKIFGKISNAITRLTGIVNGVIL